MARRFRRVWPTRLRVLSLVYLLVNMSSLARGGTIIVVVPNAYENAEAPDWAQTETLPNLRAQFIYAADQFAGLPAGGAYLISYRWRPDAATNSPADLSIDDWTLSASVTLVAPDNMSLCFDDNITGPVTVLRATAPWQDHTDNRGPPEGPKVFDIQYVLDTPYRYDPTEGNLLLDDVALGMTPIHFDRLAAGERSEAALLVRGDPADPCAFAAGYVGSIVTEFTFVPRLEGACCLPDGTCAEALASVACTDLGGTFQGPSTTCGGGSACLGACCQGLIGCSETLISQCTSNFRGYGSTCAQGCPCPDPFADADADGDVDQFDFAVLQTCFAGPDVTVSGTCLCFDRHPVGALDGDVDVGDVVQFELCASGPRIPLNPACDTW
jgi:hypothetical protein